MSTPQRMQIEIMAAKLAIGETSYRETCPYCQGGSSRDKGFSISRTRDGILYHCHRVKCQEAGFIGISRPSELPAKEVVKAPVRKYSAVPMPDRMVTTFLQKWDVSPGIVSDNRISYEAEGAIIYPIHNRMGYEVGYVRRYYDGRKPKSKTYWYEDRDKGVAFTRPLLEGSTIVLVEDLVSAIKVGQFLPTAALLGSYLSPEAASKLRHTYSKVVFWLDGNALQAAVKLKKKYKLVFDEVQIVYTKDDPKDYSQAEIESILKVNKLYGKEDTVTNGNKPGAILWLGKTNLGR